MQLISGGKPAAQKELHLVDARAQMFQRGIAIGIPVFANRLDHQTNALLLAEIEPPERPQHTLLEPP